MYGYGDESIVKVTQDGEDCVLNFWICCNV